MGVRIARYRTVMCLWGEWFGLHHVGSNRVKRNSAMGKGNHVRLQKKLLSSDEKICRVECSRSGLPGAPSRSVHP